MRYAKENLSGSKPTVMSMIIDGMDQSHCRIPYLGTQHSFSNTLKQCITGIKEHGVGVTLYRTIDTVRKGADLTIYCVLSQLEAWKMRHGYYPEELYLQVDGGSENANQYLLCILELLIVKRICRKLYYTRLPTGHTHEDIDACFAHIWLCFRNQPCETLQGYKTIVENTLSKSALKAKVIDVYVIPNWQIFLEGCIDSKLSKLHHEIHTQHQWRFEAVQKSTDFPLGCKTSYKAYSSDKVVEIIQKPKQQCISEVGQYTGLEPTTLFCPWYPAAFGICSDPRRQGVEGFYLLRDIPHSPSGKLPPCPFPHNARENIVTTLNEIRTKYDIVDSADIREAWDLWALKWAPQNDCSQAYITRMAQKGLAYHIPLKGIILNRNVELQTGWANALEVAPIDQDIQWPEIFAMAMNSVVSDFNVNAPDPRMYTTNDALLQNDLLYFTEKCDNYYEVTVKAFTNAVLISALKRKVSYSGEIKSTGGNSICIV